MLLGIWGLIAPLFGPLAPNSAASDFINHTALVAAALDTLSTVGGLPISSNAIVRGVEYPYFLFGNAGFYVAAALISLVLRLPPYLGEGVLLGLAFAVGAWGSFALARGAGLSGPLAVALGLLYASGPYLSVNLLVRMAFPEYLTWQLCPALLLVVRRAATPGAGLWSMLAGALALAVPFYTHKLVAPHAALALAVLALNGLPWRRTAVVRLWVIGLAAICFSVPAWYPLLRGLDSALVTGLSNAQRPGVLNQSWANLLWPWAQNSLHESIKDEFYGERFALQVGLVPTIGFLLGLAVVLTRPRVAIARRLVLPLLLFAAYCALIMNAFNVWAVLPAPLGYLQFTYRLLGVTHLVGFVALVYALGSPTLCPTGPRARGLLAGATVLLVGLGALSTSTYWQHSGLSSVASAEIRPDDLRDFSQFYSRTEPSAITAQAITPDGRLAIPPRPVPVPSGLTSLVLAGEVGPELFQSSTEPLVVRVYGFRRQTTDADPAALVALFRHRRGRSYPVDPISDLIERERRESRRARDTVAAGRPLAIPDIEWSVLRLAETTLGGAGRFELQFPLGQAADVLSIECSRAVDVPQEYTGWSSDRPTCVSLDYLAAADEATPFSHPLPIARGRQARGAHGTVTVDARGLPPGQYLLPTFHYTFVRVRASDGSEIPTYQVDRRTTIQHDGNVDAYTVSYALEPAVRPVLLGLLLLVAYAVLARVLDARRRARPT